MYDNWWTVFAEDVYILQVSIVCQFFIRIYTGTKEMGKGVVGLILHIKDSNRLYLYMLIMMITELS